MSKPLRQAMPETAAFIDAMRGAFGAEQINAVIRAGMDGQPMFWARENGNEVGTPPEDDSGRSVSLSEIDLKPFRPTGKGK